MRCTWFNVVVMLAFTKARTQAHNIAKRVREGRTLTSVIKTLKTT